MKITLQMWPDSCPFGLTSIHLVGRISKVSELQLSHLQGYLSGLTVMGRHRWRVC